MKLKGYEERRKKREQWLKDNPPLPRIPASLTLQLGYYIGDAIVDRYMLNLDIDYERGKNIVKVSDEDKAAYAEIEKLLNEKQATSDKADVNWPEWINYIAFRKEMQRKYIPEFLECHVAKVESVTDYDELKRGIGASMWDSDRSNYACDPDNIKIKDEGRCTVITLKRSAC